jgi:hypothetical protein
MTLRSSTSQNMFLKKHGAPLMVVDSPLKNYRLLIFQKNNKPRGFGLQSKSLQPRYKSVLTKGLSLVDNIPNDIYGTSRT